MVFISLNNTEFCFVFVFFYFFPLAFLNTRNTINLHNGLPFLGVLFESDPYSIFSYSHRLLKSYLFH